MRILIIRHGEPNYKLDALTEKGKREAALLAERLSRIPADAYYVSPLGRAQETAAYTLRRVGRTAVTLPWLQEFHGRSVNPATGLSHIPWDYHVDEWARHPLLYDPDRWVEDPLVRDGDVAQVWEETKAGLDALLSAHGYTRDGSVYRCQDNRDGTIMLFCHFAVGTAILAHLINTSPVPLWQGFLWTTSAVTTVVTQERRPGEIEFRCVSAGDVSHLLQGGEPASLAGLFPERYNGVDSTDPGLWPERVDIPVIR